MHKVLTITATVASLTMSSLNLYGQQASPAGSAAAAAKSQTSPAKRTSSATTAKTASGAKTQAPLVLKTDQEKFSYALGMNLGTSLHKQSVPVDPSILLRGLRDALAGGKTLLTPQEANAAIGTIQEGLRKKMMAKMQEVAQQNKKEGEDFLAANKTKEGVVALPSGLQYKILQEGTGPKPTDKDSVICKYRGTFINGTEFDNSAKHNPTDGTATFPVTGVIKGWTEALQLMPVGSKWQLYIPSGLAYGENGMGNDIPPNSTLVFDIELVKIAAPASEGDKK